MEKICTSPVKNYLQRNGFVMVSNLLFDYQQELGITESELTFIIRIMKSKGFAIHDKDLDSTVCSKTLSRKRNALKAKGLLKFSTIKKQDPNTGTFCTEGISYDLSPLEEKLQEISNKIEHENQIEAEKIITKNNMVVESTDDSPIGKLCENFKQTFKEDYQPNAAELKFYNNLPEEDKTIFAYAFDWLVDSGNLGKIRPRLALFMKAKFRFDELKQYCKENGLLSKFEEIEEENYTKETIRVYSKYYKDVKDNYAFYKAVERIVGRYLKNGVLPAGVEKLFDIAYSDNYNFGKKE